MRDGEQIVRVIAASLRDYITRHPDAADSIEGIRRWWLPQSLVASSAEVQSALDELVAAGVLNRRPLPDRGTLYSGRRHEPAAGKKGERHVCAQLGARGISRRR